MDNIFIKTEMQGKLIIVELKGRFDTFVSNEVREKLMPSISLFTICILFNMKDVPYISSASLRLFIELQKKLKKEGGVVVLSEPQPYCVEVLKITGFASSIPHFSSHETALAHCLNIIKTSDVSLGFSKFETINAPAGRIQIVQASQDAQYAEVLGDIRKILHSEIIEKDVYSRLFFESEFSIGIGGMGSSADDCIDIMGDFLTAGGAMVWMPSDGHNTADFLLPKMDSGKVTIHTAFNINFPASFNEIMFFRSEPGSAVTLADLYETIFTLSRKRRPDYKGVINLAIHANFNELFTRTFKKAPVAKNAPLNGRSIVDQSNFSDCFTSQDTPSHKDVSAVICGLGLSLAENFALFDKDVLNKIFYLSDSISPERKSAILYNNAVIFEQQEIPQKPSDLFTDILETVNEGSFIDMCTVRENSTITEALIGVNYIQDFRISKIGEDNILTMHAEQRQQSKKLMLDSYKKAMSFN